jgi:acrylyl-CoA reductase (NADPH)
MLALQAIEAAGVTPSMGPAIVTGAAGGVGSIAISLFAGAGWTVIASTGRPAEADYLKSLGAAEIVERATLSAPGKPLGRERWAAAVDSVGSTTLANVLAQTRYGGAVAACGLAGGMDLPTTVAPFILRGVRLLGIDSVYCPIAPRRAAWERLARDLDRKKLAAMTETFPFERAFELGARIVKGDLRGRVVLTIA